MWYSGFTFAVAVDQMCVILNYKGSIWFSHSCFAFVYCILVCKLDVITSAQPGSANINTSKMFTIWVFTFMIFLFTWIFLNQRGLSVLLWIPSHVLLLRKIVISIPLLTYQVDHCVLVNPFSTFNSRLKCWIAPISFVNSYFISCIRWSVCCLCHLCQIASVNRA